VSETSRSKLDWLTASAISMRLALARTAADLRYSRAPAPQFQSHPIRQMNLQI
jgi:hypothetical protein